MNRFATQIITRVLLASTAVFGYVKAQAATTTWSGSTDDLTLNTNWNPQTTPTSGDTAVFDGTGNLTPQITSGATSQTFQIDLVNFIGNQPYAFTIKDAGSSFTCAGSGLGPYYGIKDDATQPQNFAVNHQGSITFQNNCSANLPAGTNTNPVNYTIGDVATSGKITFQDVASAGKATISVANGDILFNDFSTAATSTINLLDSNSQLTFDDDAGTKNAQIAAKNGGQITFKGMSNGEDGTITLGDSISHTPAFLLFKEESSAAFLTINLSEGSSVTLEDSSFIGAANISMTSHDTINLNQTEDTLFYATLTGDGTLNKNGNNKIDCLSDSSSFTGVTNLNAGNFVLKNNLGGHVFVNSGGLLSGTGIVNGKVDVNTNGKISPGNSIGTMSIAATYTQAADSTYIVQVDGNGNASNLLVGDQVSINMGSGLNVVPLVTQLKANESFTAPVLTSNTGISGTYTNVYSTNPLISPSLSYDPTNVYLTWTNALALIGKSLNQQKVANQLQTLLNPSENQLAAISALALLPPDQQQHALNQLSGQPYANLLLTAEVANNKFIRRLYNPLRLLVTSHPCCVVDTCSPCGCMVDTWFDAGWDKSNFQGNKNAKGFNIKGYELTLGAQVTVANMWTVGIAGCYERDQTHYKIMNKGTSNTYLGGLYSLYRPSDFYLMGDIVIGYSQHKLRRHVDIGPDRYKNHGKPDVFQSNIYVEAGHDFGVDCFLFQPFVGIEAGYFHHDYIHEHSYNPLFALNIKEKTYGRASSRLGVHFLTELSCFKMFLDGAWQYRLTSQHNKAEERFQKFGHGFTVSGVPLNKSSFDAALNLSATVIDGLEVYVEGQGQWWKNASTYTVLGGLIINW